ncbi:hypothetical protein [Oceanobacillus chungangensis]|uniref:hypothetical protein n=1 Tax=Oceanobacillus chungangensis TaxID=1229152 RepID=UPI001FE653A9|nr:hypothetical protein [Oceanobacillus chungangensis]
MKTQKVVALLLFISLLTGCSLETKTLQEFYEKDFDHVNKIVIFDGNTGYKKTITDNKNIEDFLSEI